MTDKTLQPSSRRGGAPQQRDSGTAGSSLYHLITNRREEIIARARAKKVGHSTPDSNGPQLDDGVAVFLDQLSETLRISRLDDDAMASHAGQLGSNLLRLGFSISQVVHGYGDVCQAVTELAMQQSTPISTDEFRIFNRCLDSAIASAVTEYEREHSEGLSRKGTERLGELAHELRNSLSTALLAFGTLKRGVVGPDSSTGALLNRSLLRLRDIIDRSLSEVRLEAGVVRRERFLLKELIDELSIAASIDAANRGVDFSVAALDPHLQVDADRHLLMGAVENVVQNGLKFTHKGGRVLLTVREDAGVVSIDIEDECGGLPPGAAATMFHTFQQHSADRSGLGLGLWISRTSLLAMGGGLSVRDVPQRGCIFTITLANHPSD